MVTQCSQTTATMGRDICLLQVIAVDQTVKNNYFIFSGLSLSRRSNSDLKSSPHTGSEFSGSEFSGSEFSRSEV